MVHRRTREPEECTTGEHGLELYFSGIHLPAGEDPCNPDSLPRHPLTAPAPRTHPSTRTLRHHDSTGTRYKYDLDRCPARDGWSQIDTRQDASCYGTWTSTRARAVLSFCEGDVTETQYADDASYVQGLRELHAWAVEAECWRGIDPASATERARLTELGLADLLH